MTVHLLKLSVGAATIDELAQWHASRIALRLAQGQSAHAEHRTFQTPKRQSELLAGGSLYWVIKGIIQVRQPIVGFEAGVKYDGSVCCLILLDPALVPVRPTPRRAFQGWRYLAATDAPPDVGSAADAAALARLSPKMRRDLAELGLL